MCVQTEEHGHAPKYTLLSRRLRRFIYLLDSCPEPLTRFSTGAESPTKHAVSFSPAYKRDCHTRARTFQSRQMSPQRLQGARLCVSPHRLLHCWVSFWVSSVSPPLLLHAFSPTRLPSFQPCLLFGIPFFPTGFLSLFPFPVPLPLLPSLSPSCLFHSPSPFCVYPHRSPLPALRGCGTALHLRPPRLTFPPFQAQGPPPPPVPVGSQPCLPRRCAHREAPAGCCPFTASKSPTPSHPQLGNYCWGKLHSGAR